jgi:hypothetical protein
MAEWKDLAGDIPSAETAGGNDWASLMGTAPAKPAPKGSALGDYALNLKRGVEMIPGTLTSMADIPIALAGGGRPIDAAADWLGEKTGFQPSKWAEADAQKFSPERQAAMQNVGEAWDKSGAGELEKKLVDPSKWSEVPEAWRNTDLASIGKAYAQNPSVALAQAVESAPTIVGAGLAGGAARLGAKALGREMAASTAAAIGEGATAAGQNMDQTDRTVDPQKAALANLAAGAITGVIGKGVGTLAEHTGIATPEMMIAGAGGKKIAVPRDVPWYKAAPMGFAEEALQEGLQSPQEQAWQNYAEGKPIGEGVLRQAVEGSLAGGLLGGSANIRGSKATKAPPAPHIGQDEATAAAQAAGAPVDQLGAPIAGALPGPGIATPQNPYGGSGQAAIPMPAPPSISAAADIAEKTGAKADAPLIPFANRQAAQNHIDTRDDAERVQIVSHPRVDGRFAVVPKSAADLAAIDEKAKAEKTKAKAAEVSVTRAAQLADEEGSAAPTAAAKPAAGPKVSTGETNAAKAVDLSGEATQNEIAAATGKTEGVDRNPVSREVQAKREAANKAAETRAAQVAQEEAPQKPVKQSKPPVPKPEAVPEQSKPTLEAEAAQNEITSTGGRYSTVRSPIDEAAHAAATSPLNEKAAPTEAQQTAGNYAKGHIGLNGVAFSIENPAGSERSGTENGKSWKVKMRDHYGYIKGTLDRIGEHIDTYIKRGTQEGHQGNVFIVNQHNPADQSFDEHKVMVGYGSHEEAVKAYDSHFSDGSGPTRRGTVVEMTPSQFRQWVKEGKHTEAAAHDNLRTEHEKAMHEALKGSPEEGVADLREVDPKSLPNSGTEAKGQMTRQAHALIKAIADRFGKTVVLFHSDEMNIDGFVGNADSKTIYLSDQGTVSPVAVFGHELLHLMRREAPAAYSALARVIKGGMTTEQREQFDKYYNGNSTTPLKGDKLMEEAIADLFGNRFQEESFWTDVWAQVEDKYGKAEAKGIIRQFQMALVKAVKSVVAAIQGKGFATDALISDLEAVRKASATAAAEYFAQLKANDQNVTGETKFAKEIEHPIEGNEALKIKALGFAVRGQIVSGAPPFIQSLKDVKKQIKQAVADALSDQAHPEDAVWYREAGRAIREYAHGDKALAEKLTRIVAKLSQGAGVNSNVTGVIKAAYQIAKGETPAVGRFPNAFREQFGPAVAAEHFDTNIKGVNTKLQNFYRNLHDNVFEKNQWPNAVVIDRHAINYIWHQPGKDTVASDAQYSYAERIIQLATAEYNKQTGQQLMPRDMQAILWGHWKRRDEAETQTEEATKGGAWNYPQFFERATANVTAEVLPSTKVSALDTTLTSQQKQQFQKEALDLIYENGQNELARRAGIVLYKQGESTGGYENKINPNVITGGIASKVAKQSGDSDTYHRYEYEAIDRYAKAWQYIFKQDGVPWFRADRTLNPADLDKARERRAAAIAKGKKVAEGNEPPMMAQGHYITFDRALTPAEEADTFEALKAEFGENIGYTKMSPDTIAVINYRDENGKPYGLSDADFNAAMDRFGEKNEVVSSSFAAESRYHYHDFLADTEGSGLLEGLDVQPEQRDLRSWVQGRREAFDALAKRWESATAGQRSNGPGDESTRASPARAAEYGQGINEHSVAVEGLHYSREQRESLSGRYYGSGLKGAEAQRVTDATDSRLKQRVYFYFNTGNKVIAEAGVGAHGHRVQLNNLYDMDADPLRLAKGANAFESAVLDAGFDGYLSRKGGNQGVAVLLGEHNVPVDYLGTGKQETAQAAAPKLTPERVLADTVSNAQSLPAGQLNADAWEARIRKADPSLAEQLDKTSFFDNLALKGSEPIYRSALGSLTYGDAQMSRARTDTPEFKQWFGDSKIVGKSGNPVTLYHGIPYKLEGNAFDASKLGSASGHTTAKLGFFFTNDRAQAEQHADGGNVLGGYMRMERPYYMTAGEFERLGEKSPGFSEMTRNRLEKEGYDGVIVKNGFGGVYAFVAFKPNQFKSNENFGSFSRHTNDISFSRQRHEMLTWINDNKDLPMVPGQALLKEADQRFADLVKAFDVEKTARAANGKTLRDLEGVSFPGTPMPSVLHMLGAPNQWVTWHGSIINKVLEKHKQDPASINAKLRDPALVFRATNGELEIITDLYDDGEPIMVALKPGASEQTQQRNGEVLKVKMATVMSAYPISWKDKVVDGELKIGLEKRLMAPKGRELVYADDSKAAALFKGVGAKSPRTMVEQRLQDKKILGYMDRVKYAGDNFRDNDATRDWSDVAFSTKRDWYYSQLENAISKVPAKIDNTSGGNWLQWLNANAGKLGVKADEIKWSGITDFLQMKGREKVSVAEVRDFLDNNNVQVKDVVKQSAYDPKNPELPMGWDVKLVDSKHKWDAYQIINENGTVMGTGETDALALQDAYLSHPNEFDQGNGPKFSNYVLPGGENYKELLITLPISRPSGKELYKQIGEFIPSELQRLRRERGDRFATEQELKGMMEDPWAYADMVNTQDKFGFKIKDAGINHTTETINIPDSAFGTFQSSHWDEPNILAHIRMNDRTDAQGRKVLFLEELQSDWGQKGKREGFDEKTEIKETTYDGQPAFAVAIGGKVKRHYATREQAEQFAKEVAPSTPLAPFVTDTKAWTSLALKRAIAYAVSNGYQAISWTTGEQQSDRYDLSKQISAIRYNKVGDKYGVVAIGKGRPGTQGSGIVMERTVAASELPEIVGKDLAEKIVNGEGTPGKTELNNGDVIHTKTFAGLDLKVGGTGMKGFYDQIVGQVASKLGAKVEKIDLGVWNVKDGEVPSKQTAQPGFTISPAMVAQVNGPGMALFSHKRSFGDLTPEQEAALEHGGAFAKDKTFKQRWDDFKSDWQKKAVMGLFDQFAPLKQLSMDAYVKARLSKGSDGTLEGTMLYGVPFMNNGVPDVKIGQEGFAHVLSKLGTEQDRFFWWVAGLRAEQLKAAGLENLFGDAHIDALKTLNTGREALFAETLQKLNTFNDGILKLAEESGIIDAQARQLFKDMPYVPFYRVMEDGDMRGPTMGAGLVNQYAFKKLKGGDAQLNKDLLANTLLNWSHLFTAAAKNRASVAAMDAAGTAGVAMPSLKPGLSWNNGKVVDMQGRPVNGTGALTPQMTEAGKGSVKVLRNGTFEHWIVSDPYVMEAIGALEYATPKWFSSFATAKKWLTFGVTVNPAFKIRNLIRDSISAIGQADLSANPLKNVTQGWQAFQQGTQTHASMLAGGGALRFGTMLEGDRATHAQHLIRNLADKGTILDESGWEKFQHQMVDLFDAYQELGDKSENVNRAALYEQLLAKGHSQEMANFMARDLLDFSMSGTYPVVRFLAQVVPFMNARLQGLYKLGRAAHENPKRIGYTIGAVALGSLALLLAGQDDDDWKKREDWDRDTYWWFKIGGMAFRIPKPFEIGAIGTIAERTYELGFDKEMDAGRYSKRVSDLILQQFAMNPVPQIVKPWLDIYANKDAFSGRPIEGTAAQRLRPQDRKTDATSVPAELLGRLGIPDPSQLLMGRVQPLSPLQMDYLMRAYFGWVGTSATVALDYGMRPAMGRGDRPDMNLREVFLAGNFVETLPATGSRYVTQMYQQGQEIQQVYASWQNALKMGQPERAAEIYEANKQQIQQYRGVVSAEKWAGAINQRIKRVEIDPNLSGEDKRVQITAMKLQLDRISRLSPTTPR